MAFDKTPTTWLASWAENGTLISVPIATFPELTAAEADGSTGDIRKVAWAFLEKMFNEYNDTDSGDLPEQWTCTKSTSINATTGVVTNIFTNTFSTEILTQEVQDED